MTIQTMGRVLGLAALTMLATACGQSESYIQNWSVKNQGQQIQVNATFNQSYTVDGEARIQYKNYGSIYIGQDDNRLFTVSVDVNPAVFGDTSLAPVTTLPTGIAFPSIVVGPLGQVQLVTDGKWRVSGYFGYNTSTDGVTKALVGVGMELSAIGSSFPTLSLTQNYFTADNRKYASLTIYGPKFAADNTTVLVPGGLFLVADANVLMSLKKKGQGNIQFKFSKNFEVSGPDAGKYPTKADRQMVALKFLNALEQSGTIKRRQP